MENNIFNIANALKKINVVKANVKINLEVMKNFVDKYLEIMFSFICGFSGNLYIVL